MDEKETEFKIKVEVYHKDLEEPIKTGTAISYDTIEKTNVDVIKMCFEQIAYTVKKELKDKIGFNTNSK